MLSKSYSLSKISASFPGLLKRAVAAIWYAWNSTPADYCLDTGILSMLPGNLITAHLISHTPACSVAVLCLALNLAKAEEIYAGSNSLYHITMRSPVGYKQGNDKWELPLRRLPESRDIWRVSFYYKHQSSYERKEERTSGQEGLGRQRAKGLI